MKRVNGGLGDANSVFVNSGDVYVAGTFENNGVLPGYWKNGKFTLLNYSSGSGLSIYVAVNNVLIAGFVTTAPVLWTNGTIADLSDPSSADPNATKHSFNAVTSVSGAGNHIRIAGYKTTSVTGDYTHKHDIMVPILFTDGAAVTLDNGDSQATLGLFNKTGGRALSVFVVTPA